MSDANIVIKLPNGAYFHISPKILETYSSKHSTIAPYLPNKDKNKSGLKYALEFNDSKIDKSKLFDDLTLCSVMCQTMHKNQDTRSRALPIDSVVGDDGDLIQKHDNYHLQSIPDNDIERVLAVSELMGFSILSSKLRREIIRRVSGSSLDPKERADRIYIFVSRSAKPEPQNNFQNRNDSSGCTIQ